MVQTVIVLPTQLTFVFIRLICSGCSYYERITNLEVQLEAIARFKRLNSRAGHYTEIAKIPLS